MYKVYRYGVGTYKLYRYVTIIYLCPAWGELQLFGLLSYFSYICILLCFALLFFKTMEVLLYDVRVYQASVCEGTTVMCIVYEKTHK